MNPEQLIQAINDRINAILPQGADRFRQDLEQNVSAVIREMLAKMDLVSRDEFEVQKAILEKTQQKVKRLEEQVKALEQATQE